MSGQLAYISKYESNKAIEEYDLLIAKRKKELQNENPNKK